jgi:4-methyl-5(b-hydroxyethyl)-thiazole monophosphate biosynthesis
MAKLFVPFAEGFEEIEALTVVDVLRRAGIKVDMVGVPSSMVTGAHGVKITMDKKLPEVNVDDYDGIILPGGNPGYVNLGRSASLIEMIKKLNMKGKLIGAICAAPSVLAKAGVLENRKATIYPGMEREIPYPRGDRLVVDNNIITSQGPGTAMEFALKIVETLAGSSKALELKKSLVC